MATALELKRLRLEYLSISAGRAQTEFRIEEYMQQIELLKPTLADQTAKEAELYKKLQELEKESK